MLNIEMFTHVIHQKLVFEFSEGSLKCTAKLMAVISKEVLSKHSLENSGIITRIILIH